MHEEAHTYDLENTLDVENHGEHKGELFEYDVAGAGVPPIRVVIYGHTHGVAEDHEDDEIVEVLVLDDVNHQAAEIALVVEQVQRLSVVHYYFAGILPLFFFDFAGLRVHVIL